MSENIMNFSKVMKMSFSGRIVGFGSKIIEESVQKVCTIKNNEL